ncbi:MAG: hypothetical protein ABFC57_07360 [Veillonellales bacterium]
MDQYIDATKEIVITLIQTGNLDLTTDNTTGASPTETKNQFAISQVNKAFSSIYQTVTNPLNNR